MLVTVGYAGITTRSVAAEAGVNHGLVHYYFGSMEELLLQVLERFTRRLVYRGFLEFFFARAFTEPHSTKQIEDCVEWGLETDPETLIASELAVGVDTREDGLGLCHQVRCPVLVLHGREDAVVPIRIGEELAAATGGRLLRLPGCGHIPNARKPVLVNSALEEFVELAARAPPEYAGTAPLPPAKGESA